MYFDVNGNEIDEAEFYAREEAYDRVDKVISDHVGKESLYPPNEIDKIKDRLERIERVLFGGKHD